MATRAYIDGIWNPIKQRDVGLEYIWGKRETLMGEKSDMMRINFIARYHPN
jgi:DcaP outer membrane protein